MSALRPPTRTELAGAQFLVLGLGRAGTAMARFLLRSGARVLGFDEDAGRPLPAGLQKRGLVRVVDPERIRCDWAVVSPGWTDEHPVLRALRRRRVPVVDELDLASQFVTAPLVAVTGTNGKSTTAALVAAMFDAAGVNVFCGGNLSPGQPLSAALGRRGVEWCVVEVSSFQLERARWLRPRIGLLLNVTPDHLDRHGSLAEYIECKYRLFDRQDESDSAVLGYDDPLARRASSRGRGQKFYFSDVERVKGAYVSRGWLCFEGARVARADGTRLAGRHNRLNALAAMCAARLAGAGPNAIRRGLVGFGGLPHRLELVRVRRGVSFVNNSMCTNPAAAVRSLQAFDRRVVLIAGGRNKGLPLEPYADEIVRRASWAVLIGEVRDRLARELATRGFNRFETSPSLREAVGLAAGRARRGDTVLFSPGFASFDMFRDFRDRGRRFSNEARRLP